MAAGIGQKPRPAAIFLADKACKNPRAVILFLVISCAGLIGDLASKHYVFQAFLADPAMRAESERQLALGASPAMALHVFQRPVMPGVMFTLSTNPGIVFGTEWIPRPLVNIATLLTVLLVCIFFATSARRAYAMHVALAFIIGGALGNLYDRLFAVVQLPDAAQPIRYQVRDFIDCSGLHYPWVFNVADVLLVFGVAIIMIGWVFAERKKRPAVKTKAS
ncbi:MAG: signal peptidase II [Phycisphaerae bacterium]